MRDKNGRQKPGGRRDDTCNHGLSRSWKVNVTKKKIDEHIHVDMAGSDRLLRLLWNLSLTHSFLPLVLRRGRGAVVDALFSELCPCNRAAAAERMHRAGSFDATKSESEHPFLGTLF